MRPDLVRPHIGGVQVLFLRIEDHAVNSGPLVKLGILNVLSQPTLRVNAVYVEEASMIVERVAVDVVGCFLCGEDKNGSGLGVAIVCSCWRSVRS